MDPVKRVAVFLLDNVGHLTRPGNASYDPDSQRWYVPICARTELEDVVIGDAEVDLDGHIVYAPTKAELVARLEAYLKRSSQPAVTEVPASA